MSYVLVLCMTENKRGVSRYQLVVPKKGSEVSFT